MYVREYYDLDRNRGRIRVNQAYGGPQDIYLDYDSNMVLVVTPDNSKSSVGWLLNVPATCECISGTDLLRQLYVLPH